MNPPTSVDRSVTPVIAVLLLVVITVLMAAVSGAMLLSYTDRLRDPAPMFSQAGEMDLTIQDGAITDQQFVLVHQGGNAVDIKNLRVTVTTGENEVTVDPDPTGDLADGQWSAGEELALELNTTQVCTGGSSMDVEVSHQSAGGSFVMEEQSVPVTTDGFTIENGAVVPNSDYEAELTVLGTGFTYGAGGPNIDIRLDVVIGETRYDPWPGNVNNNGNPRTHTFDNQPAGAAIKVAATGDMNGIYISPRTRWSNASNGGWVYVLTDGDTPPNLSGFGDQSSASSYVQPYLDANDTIDLDDNQAIYLFELGNSQSGSAADFQDIVVLASISTQVQSAQVTTVQSGDQMVVCPET